MNQRKTIDEFIEELKNVRTVSTNEQKDKVIEELYRIGKRLDVTDIKEVIACSCGPDGEKGGSVNW